MTGLLHAGIIATIDELLSALGLLLGLHRVDALTYPFQGIPQLGFGHFRVALDARLMSALPQVVKFASISHLESSLLKQQTDLPPRAYPRPAAPNGVLLAS